MKLIVVDSKTHGPMPHRSYTEDAWYYPAGTNTFVYLIGCSFDAVEGWDQLTPLEQYYIMPTCFIALERVKNTFTAEDFIDPLTGEVMDPADIATMINELWRKR